MFSFSTTLEFMYSACTLRIMDILVHRPLSIIRGLSFTGVFWLSHPHSV